MSDVREEVREALPLPHCQCDAHYSNGSAKLCREIRERDHARQADALTPKVERLIAKAVATALESQAPLRQMAEAHAREQGRAEVRERAKFNDEVRREQIRMARAEAWDEGANAAVEPYNTGTRMTLKAVIPFPTNPYRSADAAQ